MDSADIDTCEPDDALALKARREALRAFVNDVAAHVQTLSLPETYLEAERACRCIAIHDRVIQTLPLIAGDALLGDGPGDKPDAILKPIRRHLRVYADRVMETTAALPKPSSFLEGERAGRYALACDRMLTQLYTAPKAVVTAKTAARPVRNPDGIWMDRDKDADAYGGELDTEEAEPLTDEQVDEWVEKFETWIHAEARAEAKVEGFWDYDGEPFDPTDPDRERRGWDPVPEGLVLPGECDSLDDWIDQMEELNAEREATYSRRLSLPAPEQAAAALPATEPDAKKEAAAQAIFDRYIEAVNAEAERDSDEDADLEDDFDGDGLRDPP